MVLYMYMYIYVCLGPGPSSLILKNIPGHKTRDKNLTAKLLYNISQQALLWSNICLVGDHQGPDSLHNNPCTFEGFHVETGKDQIKFSKTLLSLYNRGSHSYLNTEIIPIKAPKNLAYQVDNSLKDDSLKAS